MLALRRGARGEVLGRGLGHPGRCSRPMPERAAASGGAYAIDGRRGSRLHARRVESPTGLGVRARPGAEGPRAVPSPRALAVPAGPGRRVGRQAAAQRVRRRRDRRGDGPARRRRACSSTRCGGSSAVRPGFEIRADRVAGRASTCRSRATRGAGPDTLARGRARPSSTRFPAFRPRSSAEMPLSGQCDQPQFRDRGPAAGSPSATSPSSTRAAWRATTSGVMGDPARGRPRLARRATARARRTSASSTARFVQQYFPGSSPIGGALALGPGREQTIWIEIVGVVSDVRQFGLGRAGAGPPSTRPSRSRPRRGSAGSEIVVRGSGGAGALAALDPAEGPRPRSAAPGSGRRAQPARDGDRASLGSERFRTGLLLALFAGLALILASVGIAGVMSQSVRQRTGGDRRALSPWARSPDASSGGFLLEGLRLTALGLAIGAVAAALAATRVLSSFLFGVGVGRSRDVRRRGGAAGGVRGAGVLPAGPPRGPRESHDRAEIGVTP